MPSLAGTQGNYAFWNFTAAFACSHPRFILLNADITPGLQVISTNTPGFLHTEKRHVCDDLQKFGSMRRFLRPS